MTRPAPTRPTLRAAPWFAALAAAALPFTLAAPAAAQEAFPACETQRALEQVIASNGELMPDDCRNLTVTVVESDRGRLCVVDVSSADRNVLQQLRDAALPEKWWVRCDRLDGVAD